MDTSQHRILRDRVERLTRENQGLRERLAALRREKTALQKGLREAKKLLHFVPGAVVVIQEGKIIFTNEAVRGQIGYTEEELLGRDFLDLIHPDSAQYMKDLQRRRISQKSIKDRYEIYLVTKEGEVLCYDLRVKKIRHQGRKAFLINMLGIDEMKQEEMRLRRSQRMDSLVRMASGLNKELKSYLAALSDHTEHFQDRISIRDKKEARSVKMLEASYEMGSLISRQLSCLTRTEYEPSDLSLLDLRQLVKDAVDATRPKWKRGPEGHEGKISVRTYLRALSPVIGNSQEIRDVLVSMILNAVDALPNGGDIYLSTEENSGFAHVYVQDNGVGIRDDIKDVMFDPFFTTKDGSARGLGLSFALAIVTRHGGEIEFISQEGQGATFIVKFPLAQGAPVSKAKGVRAGIKNSHILVISDEGIILDLLSKSFLSKGARVTAASTGKEVLKRLSKNKFDLVIGDLDMPYLEPSNMIPKIKQLDHDLPIVLVGSGKKGMPHQGLKELGADLVIERPLEMDKIFSFFTGASAAKRRS